MGNSILQTIDIRDNGNTLGSVQTQPDGTWSFPTPVLAEGSHTLTAHTNGVSSDSWTVNVASAPLNLVAPHFRNATLLGGGREEIDYYKHQDEGFVEIPDYGMKPGDTVRVSWIGRTVTVNSEIQTVANPATRLNFKISMYEVIDCIGVNASISYTVVRLPGTPPAQSLSLSLAVSGHPGAIDAPTINSPDNNNIRVQFRDKYYSARVRFIGRSTFQTISKHFDGTYINFLIDETWHRENKGLPVLFNWSLMKVDDSRIYYSQILRVDKL